MNEVSRRRRSGARLRRATAEETSSTCTTATSTSSDNPEARATGRREKRRQMRSTRVRANGRRGVSSSSSDESCSESESDTLGTLPPSSTFNNRLSLVSEEHNRQARSNAAPDYIPPESTPGAAYLPQRAFGEVPEWARNNINSRNNRGSGQRRGSNSRRSVNASPGQQRNSVGSNPGLRGNVLAARASLILNAPFLEQRDSVSSVLSSGSHHSRSTSSGRSRGRRSTRIRNSIRGSILSLFRRTSSGSLPQAEPLNAEKVVYAVVQDEEEPPFFTWELAIYSLIILFAGILIGRYTAPQIITGTALGAEIPSL